MPSEGPLSPGTIVTDDPVGTLTAWTNPGNAAASDDSRATCVESAEGVSEDLKATNFGFAIPVGATIDGIVVEVERSSDSNRGNTDVIARLRKAGSFVGDNKASANAWTTTEAYETYGGASDLWGTTWTASEVNNSGFGFSIRAEDSLGNGLNLRVDHIRITVHYTDAVSPIAGASTITLSPAGRLTGTGNVSGASTITLSPAGFLRGLAPIAGASTITLDAAAAISAITAISGSTTITLSPAGNLTGTANAQGAATITLSPAARMTADAALSGAATITLSPEAFLRGLVELSGEATITITPAGKLTGSGELAGESSITLVASGTLAGAGALSGAATITLSAAGSIVGVIIVNGPYLVAAIETFSPGIHICEVFSPGMKVSEVK